MRSPASPCWGDPTGESLTHVKRAFRGGGQHAGMPVLRILFTWLALLGAGGAFAELSPQAKEVLELAPELSGFGGAEANFDSLASGLRLGRTVTLVSISFNGMREVLHFTPAAALTPTETVNVLEATRFELLSLGVTEPTAWQIGIVLVGGSVVTPHGTARTPGLIRPRDPARPLSLSMRSFAGSPQNYRSLVAALTTGRSVTLAIPGERKRIPFRPAGAPLRPEEVQPVLIAAAERLVKQGIGDPTVPELVAALGAVLEERERPGR